MPIRFTKGDVTLLRTSKSIVLPHVVNDLGKWGKGVVLSITKNLGPGPERDYRKWAQIGILHDTPFEHGSVLVSPTNSHNVMVAHMLCQKGIGGRQDKVNYVALEQCLRTVAERTTNLEASIHCPRFGSGLAGGNWDAIEKLVREAWADLDVTVFDL